MTGSSAVATKKIQVDGMVFGIADDNAKDVVEAVRRALKEGTAEALDVLDAEDRQVTLVLNGRAAAAVMIDLDAGPRPHQIT
jgi:hypothetical protein